MMAMMAMMAMKIAKTRIVTGIAIMTATAVEILVVSGTNLTIAIKVY